MLSATSHIELEFLTKFLNMLQLQNRLILLYQMVPLQSVTTDGLRLVSNPGSEISLILVVKEWKYDFVQDQEMKPSKKIAMEFSASKY